MTTAAQQKAQQNRSTVFVEVGKLSSVERLPGDQFILRIRAPKCAAAARPGSFVHLTCDPAAPMRRPLSIMRVVDDCIEILYKIVGEGLQRLSEKKPGDTISILGPIGHPFRPSPERPKALLIGGGVGIPPMIFIADSLRQQPDTWTPLAILGSEIPFPFARQRSQLATPWLSNAIIDTMPLLEGWGVPCRLATLSGMDGCFDGYVTDLAEQWLSTLSAQDLAKTQIFSCGPTPMLKAVAALAEKYDLPCQVSLEEFMACAVGGCGGCTVVIKTPEGEAMQRVCVDGPVFDAASVVW
ncbi:MAG: dihydroorotate dehydrogenase electron transfer subunit [Proteobacteria bacterium]|nr:dihydroorotate dehydrogenase electron transfer subunit [Pseudomonadota bacterium]